MDSSNFKSFETDKNSSIPENTPLRGFSEPESGKQGKSGDTNCYPDMKLAQKSLALVSKYMQAVSRALSIRENSANEDMESEMPSTRQSRFGVRCFFLVLTLVIVVVSIVTCYVTISRCVSAAQHGHHGLVDEKNTGILCQPCRTYEELFDGNSVPPLERTKLWQTMTRTDGGQTCCLRQLAPLLVALSGFNQPRGSDTIVRLADHKTSGRTFIGLHINPMIPVAVGEAAAYTAITRWHQQSHDVSFVIGMTVNDNIVIPKSGYYTITARMSWLDHSNVDSVATQFPTAVYKAKITRPRRGSADPGEEVLLEDQRSCTLSPSNGHLPCASITLTATLQLSRNDELTVSVSHPDQLLGHSFSYVSVIRVD